MFFSDKRENTLSLIQNAQNGSQESFELLKEKYRPLIESCSHRRFLQGMTSQDMEDMCQEALVHFCNAVCSYDTASEGVEFGLYAKICINNGLVSFVRTYLKNNKSRAISLDVGSNNFEAAVFEKDPLQQLVDKEETEELVGNIRAQLSDFENRIWWMYVSGLSTREIEEKLGVQDARAVSNAVYRIRKKLRKSIKNPY